MAVEHTPLPPSSLSAAAQQALGSEKARTMAARGMAPLQRPGDMAAVLYQLSLDSDAAIKRAACATAADLPDRVLAGALEDESLDPRVLDFFAEVAGSQPDMLRCIILNHATHGATIAHLAARVSAAEIDLIAQNEQRLLAHPEIIGAMFHNRHARMSTVDRAIELAARHEINVPNIPSWETIASVSLRATTANTGDSPDAHGDDMFARAMSDDAASPQPGSEAQGNAPIASARPGVTPNYSAMSIPQKIRLATLGNKAARSVLIRDANKLVAAAAIKAPGVTDSEASKYASNQSLSDDVIKYIAGRRDWTKSYGVKLSLVQNPKTPIPDAMRFMPHLRERDLRAVARSKGIPSAVAAQAKKLLHSRKTKK